MDLVPGIADRKSEIRLTLLGGFDLHVNTAPAALGQAEARLLAHLALRSRPVTRASLAGSLWPESTDAHAGANVRTALWKLRRRCPQIVERQHDRLALSDAVRIDYVQATAVARQLLAGLSGPTAGAVDLLESDLLPDWQEDWIVPERERFRQLRLHALDVLCLQETDAGHFAAAVEAGLASIAADPFREASRRGLTNAYLREGSIHEAAEQYLAYRRLLAEELGTRPSNRFDAVFASAGYALPSARDRMTAPRGAFRPALRIGVGAAAVSSVGPSANEARTQQDQPVSQLAQVPEPW
jgi:DNA-binding SARP family transcriptional activator